MPVRDDCAEQLRELDAIIPTVVFKVTDTSENDVRGVSVSMDGARLADRLDGSPLAVDPGKHTFSFAASGFRPSNATLVIQTRVKGRREQVTLQPEVGQSATAELSLGEQATVSSSKVEPKPSHERGLLGLSGSDQRTAAYVLGGVGVVGVLLGTYFGLHSKSTYDEATSTACPGGLARCTQAGVDGVDSAHTQAAVSTISFVLAGALVTGAVALFLTLPPDGHTQSKASLRTHASSGPAW